MPNIYRSRNPFPGIPPMPLPPMVPAHLNIQLEDVAPDGAPPPPMDDFSDPAYGQPTGYREDRDPLTGEPFLIRLQKMSAPSAYVGTFRGRG